MVQEKILPSTDELTAFSIPDADFSSLLEISIKLASQPIDNYYRFKDFIEYLRVVELENIKLLLRIGGYNISLVVDLLSQSFGLKE